MAPFISIIMPVYKVEQYLNKSVNSVLAQSFADFELLLVDDCSPDESGRLCDELAQKDNRIKVLHLPENMGAAGARNVAMREIQGEYLCFLDSDDYFDSDMLEKLADSVKKNPAHAVIFGLVEEYHDNDGRLERSKRVSCQQKIIKDCSQLREELLKLELDDLYGYPCNKMYSVEKLRKSGAVFPEMKFNEDIIFNIDFFMNAETCNFLDFAPYHYVKRTGSTTGSFIPTYYQDIMVKIDRLYSQLEYWNMLTPENLQLLALRYTRYFFSALERNCDKRSEMTHKDRVKFFKNAVEAERYERLSDYLYGAGFAGKLAKLLSTKSSSLCLMTGRIIFVIKRFLPKLFIKLS